MTIKSTLQVLLRSFSVKGSFLSKLFGLDHRENRTIADGAADKHQVYLLPHCDLMMAPHLLSFLSPIPILHELYCFTFLESRSMDRFTQSHINYKSTLRNAFLLRM